jgi:hypothetical protein
LLSPHSLRKGRKNTQRLIDSSLTCETPPHRLRLRKKHQAPFTQMRDWMDSPQLVIERGQESISSTPKASAT